jgi:hypothetical protein
MAEIPAWGNGGMIAQSLRHGDDCLSLLPATIPPPLHSKGQPMDKATQTELEAAAFRRLMEHLMHKRPEVQNIDMMNLAGFCRNCLSRWYQEAANARGIEMDKDAAREVIYGMPYEDWRAANQTPADAEKQAAFTKAFKDNVG